MALTDRKFSLGLAYASGTADRSGAALDMSGFEEVDIVVYHAAVHNSATYSIKAQCDDNSAFSSALDIEGSSQVVAGTADDTMTVINIKNPPERYVRVYVDNDTSNATAQTALYVQYGPGTKPTSQGSSVASESFVWPSTGTA